MYLIKLTNLLVEKRLLEDHLSVTNKKSAEIGLVNKAFIKVNIVVNTQREPKHQKLEISVQIQNQQSRTCRSYSNKLDSRIFLT